LNPDNLLILLLLSTVNGVLIGRLFPFTARALWTDTGLRRRLDARRRRKGFRLVGK
jgi:hypothetical protein